MRQVFILIFLLYAFPSLEGGIVRVGKVWSDERYAPQYSVQQHYDQGCQKLNAKEWEEALIDFMVIISHYYDTPFYADSLFQAGVCCYFLEEYDLADRHFTRYLSLGGNLKSFEQVFEFKYHIAERYSHGERKHLFGVQKLPRVMPGKKSALALYDEVIASLPSREIAAKALYSKASVLRAKKEYKESIETFQTLIRRFPKHSLSAEAYLAIGEVYLHQARLEAQNPDLIALAQINYQRFKKSFPGDERDERIESNIRNMQEIYASSLYETGRFFERVKKPKASAIYYRDTAARYPQTLSAQKSQERLERLKK